MISFQFFLRCGASSVLPKVRGLGPWPSWPPLKPPLTAWYIKSSNNATSTIIEYWCRYYSRHTIYHSKNIVISMYCTGKHIIYICSVCSGFQCSVDSVALQEWWAYLICDTILFSFKRKELSLFREDFCECYNACFSSLFLCLLQVILFLARKHSRIQIVEKSMRWYILDIILLGKSRLWLNNK